MSGGRWNFVQHQLTEVVEGVVRKIERNGKEKTKEERKEEGWKDLDWYEKYPEDKFHHKYPDEVIEEFKKGAKIIAEAQVYMKRIDWLLSGDDGEESFLRRLNQELSKIDGY
jgi:hypothetical protein